MEDRVRFNRRSILGMLGLAPFAPILIEAAAPVVAAPIAATPILNAYRYGLARDLLPFQAEINRRRSKCLELLNSSPVLRTDWAEPA